MYSTRQAILQRARAILDDLTPIESNCGALCSAHCCRSSEDESAGAMWLFPGEDAFYRDVPGLRVEQAPGNEGYPFLFCSHEGGEGCDRALRPLACRIFPLFPIPVKHPRTGKYDIMVIPDPRGVRHCPLLWEGSPAMTPAFRQAVKRVGLLMLEEPALRRYLIGTGEYLTGLARLLSKD